MLCNSNNSTSVICLLTRIAIVSSQTCFHTVKGSNSSISNNSIWHNSRKLNTFKHCYESLIIQLNTSHLFTHSKMIKQFIFKQFNWVSLLFAHSSNVKQFYLTHTSDPFKCYHSGPERTRKQWQLRGTQYSPNLQHYWSLTIKLFNVISWTLLHPRRDVFGVFYCPSWLGFLKSNELPYSTPSYGLNSTTTVLLQGWL